MDLDYCNDDRALVPGSEVPSARAVICCTLSGKIRTKQPASKRLQKEMKRKNEGKEEEMKTERVGKKERKKKERKGKER